MNKYDILSNLCLLGVVITISLMGYDIFTIPHWIVVFLMITSNIFIEQKLREMGKITKIAIKVPQNATLPDGNYVGIWGGYSIEVPYQNKVYQLTTDEGVRGGGFKVIVTIKDGIGAFDEVKN